MEPEKKDVYWRAQTQFAVSAMVREAMCVIKELKARCLSFNEKIPQVPDEDRWNQALLMAKTWGAGAAEELPEEPWEMTTAPGVAKLVSHMGFQGKPVEEALHVSRVSWEETISKRGRAS
jgi:hypothetical protein